MRLRIAATSRNVTVLRRVLCNYYMTVNMRARPYVSAAVLGNYGGSAPGNVSRAQETRLKGCFFVYDESGELEAIG
jgi:hypothetical protein